MIGGGLGCWSPSAGSTAQHTLVRGVATVEMLVREIDHKRPEVGL
jgi:hypothetical protein